MRVAAVLLCTTGSVADPGCLFIPGPDLFPSRFSDPKNMRGRKKISGLTFFCSHKHHKIVNFFIF